MRAISAPPSDLVLIRLAQDGDARAADELVRRYRDFALRIVGGLDFYLMGGEREDVEQEALLGLLGAIRSFRPDGGSSFRTFASFCIKRRLATALKTANRIKHQSLNWSKRMEENEDGDLVPIVDLLPGRDLESVVLGRERLAETLAEIDSKLTPRERVAIVGYAVGCSYAELGPLVGGGRAVDNALQRARQKLAA